MKNSKMQWTLGITILALLASSIHGFATVRVLTSTDGRTLPARIISKTDDTVEIIRTTDDQWFAIPLETLSEPDREFIQTWTPNPELRWDQEFFTREIHPVETLQSAHRQRRRSRSSTFFSVQPRWIHHAGYFPAYRPHFPPHGKFHHYGCYRRPMISLQIRR